MLGKKRKLRTSTKLMAHLRGGSQCGQNVLMSKFRTIHSARKKKPMSAKIGTSVQMFNLCKSIFALFLGVDAALCKSNRS